MIVYWIRQIGQILRKKLCATEVPEDCREIEILEIDAPFTYYQKKAGKPINMDL